MFSLVGLLLTIFGFVTKDDAGMYSRSLDINVNLRWGLVLSFFAVAAWALKPDQFDASDAPPVSDRNVFVVTVVAFFLAEIGDKTQIATAMLAAKFDHLFAVVAGTTLGMLLVDAPTAFLGDAAAKRIPFRAVRIAAAALFAGLGVWVLIAPRFSA